MKPPLSSWAFNLRVRHGASGPGDLARRSQEGRNVFQQILDPLGNLFATWLVALVPVVVLLFMLAILRWSAWLATLIGSIITFLLGLWVWQMPMEQGVQAYLYGSLTGVWN